MYYVYILKCKDSTLYTGYSDDVYKRLKTHNDGKGAKYTKARRPCKLVYFEEYDTKSEALSREHAIKKLSRADKLKLISKKTI